MFIELTDHLRCPVSHAESFLVLLPDAVENRQVRSGTLGCPVCNATYPITDGVVKFGVSTLPAPQRSSAPAPVAGLAAFIGLSGPGGYVGLVGDVAVLGRELASAVPGVHFAGINAPPGTLGSDRVSLMEAPNIPVKGRQLRGVVLGTGYGGSEAWIAEGHRVVLPGLRVVGAGPAPDREELQILAAANGWWVAVRRSGGQAVGRSVRTWNLPE
ncbi:MAG: hypothetical protein ABJB33_07635 [Gemmatimonadota bacterium]